ncbi:MAG TPA: EamA family transporter [Solirubrobacterales bacterium]|nr:EamA family transporter [Solirubrobacterales bacterium]
MATTPGTDSGTHSASDAAARPAGPGHIRGNPVVAVGMVVGSITSVQCGAALATTLFDRVGPAGAVFLRGAFAALILLAVAHRDVARLRRADLRDVFLFGVTLAAMNFCFYEAIQRLPLGIAVTFEFTGPLAVAVFGSRRRRDLVWAGLAALGIVLLSGDFGGGSIDLFGAALALIAGAFWGIYILLSARVGGRSEGLGGLAVAMAISGVLLAPVGLAVGAGEMGSAGVLATGLAVGILSSALPYALEIEALRRLPNAVFGVMMSLEPAVAALVGFIALGQGLDWVEAIAIGLVVAASAGALRSAATPAPRDA